MLGCAGDVPTLEVLAAADILRRELPDLKVRVVNVVDLMRLQDEREHPHGLSDREFDTHLHGRQAGHLRLPRLPVADPPPHLPPQRAREHPRARLQGGGHDDDAVRHGHAQRPRPVPPGHRRHRPGARRCGSPQAGPAPADGRRAPARPAQYTREHGEDLPEVRDWVWPGRAGRGATPGRSPRRCPRAATTSSTHLVRGAGAAARPTVPHHPHHRYRDNGDAHRGPQHLHHLPRGGHRQVDDRTRPGRPADPHGPAGRGVPARSPAPRDEPRLRPRAAARSTTASTSPTTSASGVTYEEVHADPEAALVADRVRGTTTSSGAATPSSSSARDYTDVAGPTELAYNARIAANLGAPVVLVVNGGRPHAGRRSRRWPTSCVAELHANHAQVVAVVANRCAPGRSARVRDALRAGTGCPSWAVPGEPAAHRPDRAPAHGGRRRHADRAATRRCCPARSLDVLVGAMSIEHLLDRLHRRRRRHHPGRPRPTCCSACSWRTGRRASRRSPASSSTAASSPPPPIARLVDGPRPAPADHPHRPGHVPLGERRRRTRAAA